MNHDAHKIARCVRGCATDAQYQELINNIDAAFMQIGPAAIGVVSERQRQISDEGWTPEHDDSHREGELACAAVAYAMPSWLAEWMDKNDIKIWPFEGEPNFKNRIRDLERAGALILAEIDRVRREMKRSYGNGARE